MKKMVYLNLKYTIPTRNYDFLVSASVCNNDITLSRVSTWICRRPKLRHQTYHCVSYFLSDLCYQIWWNKRL